MVPQSLGCLPGNWRCFLWCLQEAALVFLVSQSCCYRYRALWCSFLCVAASCAHPHPLLRRASRKKQCFLISWLECSNPEVFSGIFLYFFASAIDKLLYAFLDCRFWFVRLLFQIVQLIPVLSACILFWSSCSKFMWMWGLCPYGALPNSSCFCTGVGVACKSAFWETLCMQKCILINII